MKIDIDIDVDVDVNVDLCWYGYPLVNLQKTMENHHSLWENQL
jgi:hypothetical protein